ncbi:DNA topoisomerase IB [Pseudoxanthomonas dokdonensis]|nr:DNA topoisomerase IB [Pseudoxanthomonas dokdonensis]
MSAVPASDTPLDQPDPAALEHARQAGLRYVSDSDGGISRRRQGKGFSYRLPDGRPLRDASTLQRIRQLAIPPAYVDVWICSNPRGHLQATGRDARGRKQYRYHPQWTAIRDGGKFDRIIAFGQALPRLRRRLRTDLRLPGLPQRKVLALVVAVMAETLIRVGNANYTRDNHSFGLTTLRNRHVEFARGGARLQFRGKSGKPQTVQIDDPRLARLVRRCHQLPGHALFQYRDDDGQLQPVDSGQINAYLGEVMGTDFSAKDFRTWGATLAAFQQLAATPLPEPASERALAGCEKDAITIVAGRLGNTVSVCRKAYVDPVVLEGWRDGRVQRYAASARGERQWEQAALRFLKAAHRSTRPSRSATRRS